MNADLVLPATLAVALGLLLCARPKALVLLTVTVVLFTRTIAHLSGVDAVGNLDDALVVLCTARAALECVLRRRAPRGLPGWPFFLGFVVCGIASALLHGAGVGPVTMAGTYLACKFLLFGWAVAQFDWRAPDVARIVRGVGVVTAIVLAACVLDLVDPDGWSAVFGNGGQVNGRYGLASLIGPFEHPFDLAFFCSMVFVAVLAYRQHVRRSAWSTAILVGTGAATLLTFRRKDLLGLVAALSVHLVRFRRSGAIVALVVIAPIVVVLAWQEISAQIATLTSSYFTVDSDEARTILLLGAVHLAGGYLPLGAGFGRFASRTAATNYSPEYYHLGIDKAYGLGPGTDGTFLTDTAWPAILGETGVLGTAFFVAGLIAVIVAFRRLERGGATTELRLLGTVGVGWFVLTLFQSTGAAVFSSPPVYASLLGLAGLAVALKRTTEQDLQASPNRLEQINA